MFHIYLNCKALYFDWVKVLRNKSLAMTLTLFLLLSTFSLASNIEVVQAYEGSITIEIDGSVTPKTAPIQKTGDIYLVTEDINCEGGIGIIIRKSNVTIDGQEHTLTGTTSAGIYVGTPHAPANENVTIKNFEISNFSVGITIGMECTNIIIHKNKISGSVLEYHLVMILGTMK